MLDDYKRYNNPYGSNYNGDLVSSSYNPNGFKGNQVFMSNQNGVVIPINNGDDGEETFKSKTEAKLKVKYPKMKTYALIQAGIIAVIGVVGIALQAVLIAKDAKLSVAAGKI